MELQVVLANCRQLRSRRKMCVVWLLWWVIQEYLIYVTLVKNLLGSTFPSLDEVWKAHLLLPFTIYNICLVISSAYRTSRVLASSC